MRPRDELLPMSVIKRVMPRPAVVEPTEPTLLDELVKGFYEGAYGDADASAAIENDGKARG